MDEKEDNNENHQLLSQSVNEREEANSQESVSDRDSSQNEDSDNLDSFKETFIRCDRHRKMERTSYFHEANFLVSNYEFGQ